MDDPNLIKIDGFYIYEQEDLNSSVENETKDKIFLDYSQLNLKTALSKIYKADSNKRRNIIENVESMIFKNYQRNQLKKCTICNYDFPHLLKFNSLFKIHL